MRDPAGDQTAAAAFDALRIRMERNAAKAATSPFYALASLDAFKRRALAGGKKIAKGAGRFVAIIGRLPKPYGHIQGE